MRLALLTYSTRPRGGVVHTLALAEALAARGHDVTVWSLGRGGDQRFFREVDPAVRLRIVAFVDQEGEEFGARIVRSIQVLGEAFAAAATSGDSYDVVHAQDCITANAVTQCVRTVHHLDQFSTPELVACHERALHRPRALVCVSAAVADELRVGWGLAATVIPNGVDAARFAAAAGADEGAVDARLRWRAELGRYVLALGGVEPRKGTMDLVRAMALVTAEVPEVRLVVAGGQTLFDYRGYRAEVEAEAAVLGVQIVELGLVADPDVPSLVAAADVFAFCSTKEGFGLAAMEALAAGVPLVARDLPVLREVFDGAARFAIDPAGFAAHIVAALTLTPGDSGALDMTERGRRLATTHTWAAAAAAHESFYASLAQG